MSNLSNQPINQSFQGILQVPGGITSSLKTVQDGSGNPTGLQLSSTGANVTTSNTYVASIDGVQLVGAEPRLISDGFGDSVNVKDFGAVCDGVTDDTAAINLALSSGANVITADGTCLISSALVIRNGITFIFNTLIPSSSTTSVITQYGGSSISGTIDVSAMPLYSTAALVIDGNGETQGSPFRLHIRTTANVLVKGSGISGTAVYFKAVDASARIMGVEASIKVSKMRYGVYMSQTSTDLSKFITSNNIYIESSDTLTSLSMNSSHINYYGIDGNNITVKSQPKPATTYPMFELCGQDNTFDLLPWDWDAEAATAPYAATIAAFSRYNIIYWHTNYSYILNNSADYSNTFVAPRIAGINVPSITGTRSDAILPITQYSPGVDNNVFYKAKNSLGYYVQLVGIDASNNVLLIAPRIAGANIVFDTNNATGIIAMRLDGTNKLFIDSSSVAPGSNNAQNLGTAGARWSNTYSTNYYLYDAATGTMKQVQLGAVDSGGSGYKMLRVAN